MIDWTSMPPLAMLRAFAAYAETGSVARAGARLNVTHAAISQHIRALERHLGCQLLDRSGRQGRLTDDGTRLAQALKRGFETIANTIEELTTAETARPIVVSATPSIASAWLMPRLPDFRARHPEIDLMIDASSEVKELSPGGVDVALRYGSGEWPGLQADLLMKSPIVVVGAPSLVKGAGKGSDLSRFPWLQELGTSEASDFLLIDGAVPTMPRGTTSLPGNMMLDAAREGQGLAAVARVFVEADIRAGRLKELHRDSRTRGYYVVTRPGVLRPSLAVFVKWLRRQADANPNGGAE